MDFNKELEKEIIEFHKEKEMEHYNNILNLLPYSILRTPTYLLKDPTFNEKKELVIKRDNSLLFCVIEDSDGGRYIPVFTSEEKYKKMSNIDDASIYHLEFNHIMEILSIEKDLLGIAINPVDQNIVIEKEVIFALSDMLETLGEQEA